MLPIPTNFTGRFLTLKQRTIELERDFRTADGRIKKLDEGLKMTQKTIVNLKKMLENSKVAASESGPSRPTVVGKCVYRSFIEGALFPQAVTRYFHGALLGYIRAYSFIISSCLSY